jgi:hypothetical protein
MDGFVLMKPCELEMNGFLKSFYRSCLQYFELQNRKKEEKKKYSTKEVKRIKINLDFIFNNFRMHRFATSIEYTTKV